MKCSECALIEYGITVKYSKPFFLWFHKAGRPAPLLRRCSVPVFGKSPCKFHNCITFTFTNNFSAVSSTLFDIDTIPYSCSSLTKHKFRNSCVIDILRTQLTTTLTARHISCPEFSHMIRAKYINSVTAIYMKIKYQIPSAPCSIISYHSRCPRPKLHRNVY